MSFCSIRSISNCLTFKCIFWTNLFTLDRAGKVDWFVTLVELCPSIIISYGVASRYLARADYRSSWYQMDTRRGGWGVFLPWQEERVRWHVICFIYHYSVMTSKCKSRSLRENNLFMLNQCVNKNVSPLTPQADLQFWYNCIEEYEKKSSAIVGTSTWQTPISAQLIWLIRSFSLGFTLPFSKKHFKPSITQKAVTSFIWLHMHAKGKSNR